MSSRRKRHYFIIRIYLFATQRIVIEFIQTQGAERQNSLGKGTHSLSEDLYRFWPVWTQTRNNQRSSLGDCEGLVMKSLVH